MSVTHQQTNKHRTFPSTAVLLIRFQSMKVRRDDRSEKWNKNMATTPPFPVCCDRNFDGIVNGNKQKHIFSKFKNSYLSL